MENKKLTRSKKDRILMGVSGGLAEYFNIDVVIVRILWIVAGLLSAGHAIIAYIVLAILMPEVPDTMAKAHGFDPDEEIVVKSA
jgi:phage shock protein C